jgi:hypothetical protein
MLARDPRLPAGSAASHTLWLVLFCALLLPPAINLVRRGLVT